MTVQFRWPLGMPLVRNDSAAHAYSLTGVDSQGRPNPIDRPRLFTGLTIDNPADEDWYKFQLSAAPVKAL